MNRKSSDKLYDTRFVRKKSIERLLSSDLEKWHLWTALLSLICACACACAQVAPPRSRHTLTRSRAHPLCGVCWRITHVLLNTETQKQWAPHSPDTVRWTFGVGEPARAASTARSLVAWRSCVSVYEHLSSTLVIRQQTPQRGWALERVKVCLEHGGAT